MNASRRALIAGLLALPALASPVASQSADTSARPGGYLPADHWTRLALRRAVSHGLAGAAWVGRPWSSRLSDVRLAIEHAVRVSADLVEIDALSAVLGRLESDFGAAPAGGGQMVMRLDAGWSAHDGRRLAGLAVPSPDGYDYTPPPAWPDSARAVLRATGWAGHGPLMGGFDLETDGDRLAVRQLDVSARLGPVDVRLGRQPLALGPGVDEGIVLGPEATFDGIGIGPAEPFMLPSFLRGLGGVQTWLLVARLDASGDIDHPWFAAMRLAFEPSGRWAVGLNRAAIFGGTGNDAVTARRLLLLLAGFRDTRGKDSDFENQVASVDLAVRLGGPLALLGYLEFGLDDVGISIDRLAGVLAGIEANRIPGAPGLALGAELTGFGGSCCGYPPWYRHGKLAAGWADRGRLLGHALGGHGAEAALTWRLDPGPRGYLAAGRLFLRDRGVDNVFVPDRRGTSVGGRLRFSLPFGRYRAEGEAGLETGSGWREWSLVLTAGRVFGG